MPKSKLRRHPLFNRRNFGIFWQQAMKVTKDELIEELKKLDELYGLCEDGSHEQTKIFNEMQLLERRVEKIVREEDRYCCVKDMIGYESSGYYFDAISLYDDARVGRLKLNRKNGALWLEHIEVNELFRRKGVAMNMLELALERFPNLQIPCNTPYGSSHLYYLTTEGAAFINHCLAKGVINRAQHCNSDVPLEPGNSHGLDAMGFFEEPEYDDSFSEEQDQPNPNSPIFG